ncbi:MAG: hypothetical protein JWO31_494 [Phycisphaerales bacterium]|nr:hypothetical protein [Phycisphaerales bacterium]
MAEQTTKPLDIRVPMGTMFTLYGVILAGYGLLSNGSPAYARSLGINVNLWWGSAILLFGVALLALSWHANRRHAPHG